MIENVSQYFASFSTKMTRSCRPSIGKLLNYNVSRMMHTPWRFIHLPPTKEEVLVFARVCLSVSKITQKRVLGFE